MNLDEKIKEIRNKPKHIRLRYVYGALSISMVFILLIWIFSVKNMFQSSAMDTSTMPFSTLKEHFKESLPEEKTPSLEELLKENSQRIKEDLETQEKASTVEEEKMSQNEAQEKFPPSESMNQPEAADPAESGTETGTETGTNL